MVTTRERLAATQAAGAIGLLGLRRSRRGGPVRPRSRCGRRVGPRSGVHRPVGLSQRRQTPPRNRRPAGDRLLVGVERRLGAGEADRGRQCRLADWLSAWADDDGRPVHLFAHSLGARVTGATLREPLTVSGQTSLASVSLFGGAIPNDSVAADGRYGPLSRRSMPPCLTSTVGPITSSAGCIASRIGLAQSVTGARGVIDCADRLCGCRRYRPGRGPLLVLPAGRRVSTASGRPGGCCR